MLPSMAGFADALEDRSSRGVGLPAPNARAALSNSSASTMEAEMSHDRALSAKK